MSVIELERVVTRADVLTRAADLLEEFGWLQGRLSGAGGKMCAVGAIFEAAHDLFPEASADVLLAACYIHGGAANEGGMYPLAQWNDAPGRTKAEVVAELRRFAAEEDP